jgi:hypothetical protein
VLASSSLDDDHRWVCVGVRHLRRRCCQGGARTPTFRVTAGRLTIRPPGIGYRGGESNPGLRVEGPASSPLDHRGADAEAGRLERPRARTPTCFRDRLLIQPGRFHVGALGGDRTHDLVRTGGRCAPWDRTQPCPGQEPGAIPVRRGAHRWAGRESNPLCRDDGWSTASCAPRRDRPAQDRFGHRSHDDASAVVKELTTRLVEWRVAAGSEGVEPPAVGVGSRGATVARALEYSGARDVVRVISWRNAGSGGEAFRCYQRATGLPTGAVFRRPGRNSCSSRELRWHTRAPTLVEAVPRSVSVKVSTRAIGTPMVGQRRTLVNGFSVRPAGAAAQQPPAPRRVRTARFILAGSPSACAVRVADRGRAT